MAKDQTESRTPYMEQAQMILARLTSNLEHEDAECLANALGSNGGDVVAAIIGCFREKIREWIARDFVDESCKDVKEGVRRAVEGLDGGAAIQRFAQLAVEAPGENPDAILFNVHHLMVGYFRERAKHG